VRQPLDLSAQSVKLEGVPNARELGGYEMIDGRHVRRGCLIRCGCLHNATDSDVAFLKSLGVRYVFDYRTDVEQKHRPDRIIEGVEYVSLPCIDPEVVNMADTQFSRIVGKPDFLELLSDYAFTEEAKDISYNMYRNLVLSEYTQLQYSTFLNYALRDNCDSLLWHCSQGKDRTGIGSAFMLAALGAERELILEDFDLSNRYYEKQMQYVMSQISGKGGGEDEFDVVRSLLGVNTMRFSEALDEIDTHYGSMQQYLQDQLCITKEEIVLLKNKFLQ